MSYFSAKPSKIYGRKERNTATRKRREIMTVVILIGFAALASFFGNYRFDD